jgi:hypothetical protein
VSVLQVVAELPELMVELAETRGLIHQIQNQVQ